MIKKRKKNLFTTYIRFTFIISFLLLVFVASINYYIDPGNIYSSTNTKYGDKLSSIQFTKQLIKSNNGILYNSNIWNLRDIKKSLAELSENSDCAIIGSSRVMQISSERSVNPLNEICPSLINLGIPGTSIEDYLISSMNLLKNDNPPKTILISIDPWLFFMNRDKRWKRHEYEFSLMKKILEKNLNADLKKNNLEKGFFNLSELLNLINYEYFMRSINFIFSKKNELIKNAPKFDFNIGLSSPVVLPDGSIVYSKKYLQKNYALNTNGLLDYDIRGISNENIASGKWFQDSAVNLFIQLIVFLKNDFDVILIIAPYHPAVWKIEEQSLVHALKFLELKTKDIAKSLNIKVIGTFDPIRAKCKKNDFVDSRHPKIECLVKTFKLK